MATKKIPVTASEVSGSHSAFPFYLKPSVMTGWESLTTAEAESIRLYEDADLIVEIPREVVSNDEIHGKAGTLDDEYEVWGDYDSIRADYATDATYGAEAVWPLYVLVSHNGGGDDSTGNGYAGTAIGGVTSGGSSGKIGSATEYDGSDDRFEITRTTDFETTDRTISAWINTTQTSSRGQFFGKSDSDKSLFEFYFRVHADGTLNCQQSRASGGSAHLIVSGTATINTGNDVFVAGVMQGGVRMDTYINGSVDGSDTNPIGTPFYGASNLSVGSRPNNTDLLEGLMSELRVTDINLSANWITTEYNNQNDVASFWGTVTDVGPAPSGTLGLKLGSTTINKVMLGSTEIKKVYLGTTVIYENL